MILDEIVIATRKRVEEQKKCYPFSEVKSIVLKILQKQSEEKRAARPFEKALKRSGMQFICEVKKASPSKGILVKEFIPKEIAIEYEYAGASCLSVLTEPTYFLGKNEYIEEVKSVSKLPVLRKDFILDEYQIYEAKLLGADCILLICAILSPNQLVEYLKLCESLSLSALVETHNEEEVNVALTSGATIIGVNNRDLKTFDVNLETAIRLRSLVPNDVLFVAESGIKTATDIKRLEQANVNAVLIGETMVTSTDKRLELEKLKSLLVDNEI